MKPKESVQEVITYIVMILLIVSGTTLISMRNRSLEQKKTDMSGAQISQIKNLSK